MQKIRKKSLVIKSEGFFGLLEGENAGKGGKWYKERGKWIIESRIEFPDPILMTLDTSYGPITKFLKKCPRENEGENYFFPTLVFDSKTRSQFRPACKKIREKSLKTKSGAPHPLYGNVDIPL